MKRISEQSIQGACFQWFHNNYCLRTHNPRYVMFVVPNEIASVVGGVLKGFRVPQSTITKVISMVVSGLRSVGLRDGVSDNIIIAPSGKVYFVEFKTPTGTQQENQKEFQEVVTNLGHRYIIIRSLEQFKEFVSKEVIE